ncbi:MAG: radical SAM protein [Lachnospiraceae bacterium]|nr:radical SAM protein [Lachnospiraceae bacterium]
MGIASAFKGAVISAGISGAIKYLEKDPEKNVPKIVDWVNRFSPENSFKTQREYMTTIVNDPESAWYKLIMNIMHTVDSSIMKTIFTNFFMNANLIGWKRQEEIRQKYGCNAPWAILLDPTSACNLHCTGCWAAEYGHKLNLSVDEINEIIRQGKEIGTYMYIYTGGEPLVRKNDLIKICEQNSDCIFLSFTNGTLIDEEFADEMFRVKNFVPAISNEGFAEVTDGRRGEGVFEKSRRAMEILKERKLPFGISCAYTRDNVPVVSSDEYFDALVEWGAKFVWFFHLMPTGMQGKPELMPTPEQRKLMYDKVRSYRGEKAIFAMDFQNDGEFVGGCIAGGRRYFHINANGDCEPCVFIHYSDSNIREKTLLETLTSPLFMAYHDGQPFNDNMLRPCPMLENPEFLQEIVNRTGAHSTDLEAPESVEHLCGKCAEYAKNWKPVADELWKKEKEFRDEGLSVKEKLDMQKEAAAKKNAKAS